MLSVVLKYLEEKRTCPHCGQALSLCHAPAIHVGDGLGWGAEYLFICLNDECSLYVKGWEYISSQYHHTGSYRYMELPNSAESHTMMVGGPGAFTGSVVDVEALKRQDSHYQRRKQALAQLDTCCAEHNLEPVLTLLLDEGAGLEDRRRALALLPLLDDLACIEPLRGHSCRDSALGQEIDLAIRQLLDKHFLRECPYCKELIKARAVVCKHCQRDVA
ncbi:MAG: zinc ribbon domain-containing protein [Desulfobulbus sp.]|jgi:hypothetical protein